MDIIWLAILVFSIGFLCGFFLARNRYQEILMELSLSEEAARRHGNAGSKSANGSTGGA